MEIKPPEGQLKSKVVLLVEGNDEFNFFGHLLKKYGFSNTEIRVYSGKDNFPRILLGLKADPGFQNVLSLGIVRDADTDAQEAFKSVCGELKGNKLTVPKAPFLSYGSNPKITVAILPDGKSPGMIEDVCLQAVKDDTAMYCVEEYFKCLKNKSVALPKNMSKAKLQVFLGSKPETFLSIGVAAKNNYWPINGPFKIIENFLTQVCT